MTALSRSLTIRLSGPALRQLRARARSLGVTPSDLVRQLVERETGVPAGEPAAAELTSRWVGAVHSRDVVAGREARAALADWNPDRRD
jgi:hypothetical protein